MCMKLIAREETLEIASASIRCVLFTHIYGALKKLLIVEEAFLQVSLKNVTNQSNYCGSP